MATEKQLHPRDVVKAREAYRHLAQALKENPELIHVDDFHISLRETRERLSSLLKEVSYG